ncbi:MAG: hypothetical protein ACFWUM_03420 [Eubacteriales bacterium]
MEPDTTGTVGFLSDKIEVWAAQIRFMPFCLLPSAARFSGLNGMQTAFRPAVSAKGRSEKGEFLF